VCVQSTVDFNSLFLASDGVTTADLYSPCKRQPALGIESGVIENSAFYASSYVQGREPFTARLNARYGLFPRRSIFSSHELNSCFSFYYRSIVAWRPAYMDADQYLFVDLGSRHYVTSIATQGRRAAKEYVTIYNIMYSDNGHNWFYYTDEDKIIVVSHV
jgi:hypothetical protein